MYSWFVAGRALTKDNKEAGASADKKAQGTIKYLDPTKKEKVVISKAAGMDRIQAYAENGMWYDTLSEFAKLIKKNPKDKELLAFRTGFLTQVGLNNTVRCIQGKDPIVEK